MPDVRLEWNEMEQLDSLSKDNWIIAIAIGDNDNTLAPYYTS